MNDNNEGLSLAKIAIGVILLLIVIGVVISIVVMGQSSANTAQNDLANTMDGTANMKYQRYDNQEVTGSDVTTAISTYTDANIKIFIGTKSGNGGNVYKSSDVVSGSAALANIYSYGYMGVTGAVESATPTYNATEGRFEADIVPDTAADEKFNTNIAPISDKNSKNTYVRTNGRFYSWLVYDEATGDVNGILFLQTK